VNALMDPIEAPTAPLASFIQRLESGSRPTGGASSSGVLSLGAEHIAADGRVVVTEPRFVPKSFADGMRSGTVSEGDLLLVKDGATTGRLAFAGPEWAGSVVNEHVFLLRAQAGTDPWYLYLALRSPAGQRSIQLSYQGSAQGGINQSFADRLCLPNLPEPEQRLVATALLERLGFAAEIAEATQRIHQAALALALSVVAEATGSLPATGCLGDVLRGPARSGWSPVEDADGETAVLTLSSILNYRYDGSQVKYTSEPVSDDAHYWARPGDLFISRSNTPGLVGQAALYDGTPQRVIFSDLLMRLDVDSDKADPRFVWLWLMSPIVRQFIRREARGSSGTMKKINQEIIDSFPFPTAISLDQQREIAQRLSGRLNMSGVLSKAARQQREAALSLPSNMLRNVFKNVVYKENHG
jgi:type I restriction enzyme S subunit